MPNYISDNTGYEVDSIIDSFNHFRKTIIVHCLSGSTVTVSNGQETYTKVSTTTELVFNPKAYGVYNITCLYNGTTQIESLEIDKVRIYEVFFSGDVDAYLTFRSANQFSLSTANSTKNWNGTIEYSTDKELWNTWDGTTALNSINNILYLRGIGNSYISGAPNYTNWNLVGTNIYCSGNIETILDYQTVEDGNHPTMSNWCYENLFNGCTSLITAPELPATTLSIGCYGSMFMNCTSLITAPELPATTLSARCYENMFWNCTSLTTAPSLPATTLSGYCYSSMFVRCTGLTTPAILPATTLAESCYQSMFLQCSNIKLYTSSGIGTTEYRIPSSGTGVWATDALTDMFNQTGGDYATWTPIINTTYYY